MSLTLSAAWPYLMMAGGYLIRHYDLLGRLGITTPAPTAAAVKAAGAAGAASVNVPAVQFANRPVLSDAVNAAISQAIKDAYSGHVASLKSELESAVSSAVTAAVADLKAKPQ